MKGTDAITLTIDRPETITYTVSLTTDAVDANVGDGVCDAFLDRAGQQCTLRAAIQEANATEKWGAIVLPAGTFRLTVAGSHEDAAASGDLDINGPNLTISGAGPAQTVIDAAGLGEVTDRVLDIYSTEVAITVRISGITIRNGRVDEDPGGCTMRGGGIKARDASLTLESVFVINNRTDQRGLQPRNGWRPVLRTNPLPSNLDDHGDADHLQHGPVWRRRRLCVAVVGRLGAARRDFDEQQRDEQHGGIGSWPGIWRRYLFFGRQRNPPDDPDPTEQHRGWQPGVRHGRRWRCGLCRRRRDQIWLYSWAADNSR